MDWYWILLICLGGTYVLIATIMFIFPVYRVNNKIVITRNGSKYALGAHRGGSFERLENSLAAFQHSRETGMHMVELDVQLTKDGQVVVCHDESIKRLTGIDKNVSDINYEDIPRAMEEVKVHFGDHSYVLQQEDDGRIPLLRDVFRDNPDMFMNIDLKHGGDELITKVHDLIVEFQRQDITCWGSGIEDVSVKVYKK